jgi:hypothetical protein
MEQFYEVEIKVFLGPPMGVVLNHGFIGQPSSRFLGEFGQWADGGWLEPWIYEAGIQLIFGSIWTGNKISVYFRRLYVLGGLPLVSGKAWEAPGGKTGDRAVIGRVLKPSSGTPCTTTC